MGVATDTQWGWLKEHSSTLFIAAGVLMLVAISISHLRETPLLSSPPWVHNLLGPLGVACTAYGLVVFYPWVADASPRLARLGAGVSAVSAGAISLAIAGATLAATLTGTTITTPPGWVPILYFSSIVSLSLGFLLYGVASLRTGVPSRSVGVTMVVPAGLLFALFVGETTLGMYTYLPRVVFLTSPLFFIALGLIVRVGTGGRDRVESPSEAAV